MKVGDRLAIKSTAVRKLGLPFEYAGATASLMRVKVTGTIIANHEDGRSVEVEWDEPFDPPREWYFYTQRSTIWKLRKDDERARRLIRFAFYGADQDYAYFLGNRIPDGPEVVFDAGDGEVAVEQAPPYDIADLMAEGVFLEEVQIEQWLRNLRLKKNLILQGAPGVGKTFLALRLAYVLMQAKDKNRVTLVQFHPSYSYEDFVRGYRPTAEVGKFGLVDGPFLEICKKATADRDREYVLIIDEVNRGNISQIFGELIMLLEADKRGPEYAVSPLYRKTEQEEMQIPSNLYIIGTMNIADRSLALVDYALRRRFAFASLEPQFNNSRYRSWLENRGMPNELVQQIIARMTTLNETIAEDPHLGPAYRVGHSFFCPTGKDFSGLNLEWYSEIIVTEIQPLLEAYWYDNLDKATASCKELLG
jgi:5-methylcytosine-specific restriction protein B